MRDLLTVIKFTMNDMLHRKSYIISTIIILIFIIIGFNIPNIIKSFDGGDTKERIIINDVDNAYEGYLEYLSKMDENLEVDLQSYDIDTIKEKILNDEVDLGVIVNKENNNIKLTYVVDNMMFSDTNSSLNEQLVSLYKNIQLEKLNLNEEERNSINPTFEVEFSQAEKEAQGNVFAMMFMSIALFYAIYFSVYQVSSSITTEKTSKIIETLVTSTSPKNIVLGKTIGIGLVGLLQLILFLVVAIICANLFLEKELLELIFDTSSLTIGILLITLLYFVLGYFLYALLYALTGSTVSKPEDIQSANTPVAIITVIGFYLAYFTMMNPSSSLNTLAGLIPISSAFCMPFRIMMGMAPLKEVLLSLVILVVTILIVAKLTINIYSSAILNYGSKLSIKDLIRMYKEK